MSKEGVDGPETSTTSDGRRSEPNRTRDKKRCYVPSGDLCTTSLRVECRKEVTLLRGDHSQNRRDRDDVGDTGLGSYGTRYVVGSPRSGRNRPQPPSVEPRDVSRNTETDTRRKVSRVPRAHALDNGVNVPHSQDGTLGVGVRSYCVD